MARPDAPHDDPRPKNSFGVWSFPLGRPFGIRLRVHATFLILLAWVAYASYGERKSVNDAAVGVVFLLLVFAVVVLHELSHALTARRFGIRTHDITLLPIGGVSSLERLPANPAQELLVAIAGPAVNVVLAIVLFGVGALLGLSPWNVDPAFVSGSLVERLAWANVTLAVFNLLPAFPMDGGRVLRAALAMRMSRVQATQAAAVVGRVLAVGFAAAGVFWNPMLLLIAWFVWVGATHEETLERSKALLHGLTSKNAMISDVRTLTPDEPLARAAIETSGSFQSEFPVVVGDHPVGIVSRSKIQQAHGALTVSELMEVPLLSTPEEPLEDLIERIGTSSAHAVVVVDHGHLRGLVTEERLADLLLARRAA